MMINRVELRSFLIGIAADLLCCVAFMAAAQRLTDVNPASTFVLTYAPLIQGALIAGPVIGASRLARRREKGRSLAAGLVAGIPVQIACFALWYEHWTALFVG